jgi:hypothetical protein
LYVICFSLLVIVAIKSSETPKRFDPDDEKKEGNFEVMMKCDHYYVVITLSRFLDNKIILHLGFSLYYCVMMTMMTASTTTSTFFFVVETTILGDSESVNE